MVMSQQQQNYYTLFELTTVILKLGLSGIVVLFRETSFHTRYCACVISFGQRLSFYQVEKSFETHP